MPPAVFEIPGFSAEQVSSIVMLMDHMLDTALEKRLGPLQPLPLQPFVPLPAQLPKQQEQEKPLPQAIAENTAESTSGSSRPIDTSLLPTMPGQTARQLCREWTPYTGFLAFFLASSLASFFGSLLASFLASLLGPLLGYIECTEGMEATGQG